MKNGAENLFEPLLIVGLGNPGETFKQTYHNVGVLAVETFARECGAPSFRQNRTGKFTFTRSGERLFLKPMTFMNESGPVVAHAARHFNIVPTHILIVHDDSDLVLGTYKLIFDQGPAGHRGVASIIKTLGTKSFWRLRIGIRPVREKKRAAASALVLRQMTRHDQGVLGKLFTELTTNVIVNEKP